MNKQHDCEMGSPLDMVGEEGIEVAKEVFKAHRFGLDGKIRGYDGHSPREGIIQEIGDFLAAVEHLVMQPENGFDIHEIFAARERKHQKLKVMFGVERPSCSFVFVGWDLSYEPSVSDYQNKEL